MNNNLITRTLLFTVTNLLLTGFSVCHASDTAAAKEGERVVLTPSKGGVSDRTYSVSQAPEITVAAYNIAAGRVGSLNAIADAIKALNADVIALSEVDINTRRSGNIDQLATLKKLTGMYGAFGKAIDFQGGEYGIAVLSRYPVTRQATIPQPSPKVEQSVLLATEIHKPGFDSPVIFIGSSIQGVDQSV